MSRSLFTKIVEKLSKNKFDFLLHLLSNYILLMASHYDIPSWAGKPPVGLHLDVLKETKLVQKLMIDEKKCYLFGRNAQMTDFCIDHQSTSRVHAALVYHKHLHRAFLVDLGSTHGTYIGNVRIEGHKPTQIPLDTHFHFGASTRIYIIRERPQGSGAGRNIMEELEKSAGESESGGLLGLPETEIELDNLTEFNTAHNRRIAMMGIHNNEKDKDGPNAGKKRKKIRIYFAEDEEIINPEDVDPTIGRFRNLIETTIIPKKRARNDLGLMGTGPEPSNNPLKRISNVTSPTKTHGLYEGLDTGGGLPGTSSLFSSKLGFAVPNPAPDIDMAPSSIPVPIEEAAPSIPAPLVPPEVESNDPNEPKKKKYAKEAWPGKKPVPSLLV